MDKVVSPHQYISQMMKSVFFILVLCLWTAQCAKELEISCSSDSSCSSGYSASYKGDGFDETQCIDQQCSLSGTLTVQVTPCSKDMMGSSCSTQTCFYLSSGSLNMCLDKSQDCSAFGGDMQMTLTCGQCPAGSSCSSSQKCVSIDSASGGGQTITTCQASCSYDQATYTCDECSAGSSCSAGQKCYTYLESPSGSTTTLCVNDCSSSPNMQINCDDCPAGSSCSAGEKCQKMVIQIEDMTTCQSSCEYTEISQSLSTCSKDFMGADCSCCLATTMKGMSSQDSGICTYGTMMDNGKVASYARGESLFETKDLEITKLLFCVLIVLASLQIL